jgi:hypothetical protein
MNISNEGGVTMLRLWAKESGEVMEGKVKIYGVIFHIARGIVAYDEGEEVASAAVPKKEILEALSKDRVYENKWIKAEII